MKKRITALLAASAMIMGTAAPAFADGIGGLLATTTVMVVDMPTGTAYNALWKCPTTAQHGLAEAFGDEKGFGQNVVGAIIGIPFGMVWGVPTGAIKGAKHGLNVGWEKPFSGESFNVTEEN